MDALTRFARSAGFPLLLFVTILLPLSVGAQPVLSVNPTSVIAQANESTSAPSKTVRVSNGGNEELGWSVVLQETPAGPPTAGWLNVSPMSGTNNALTLTFQAQPAGQYQTKFQVVPTTGSSGPVTVTVNLTINGGTPPSPPPTSGVGPQSTITCPDGAVDILPGQYIQAFVNLSPETTTFCLRAGVHLLTSSITPKTGNTFVGEYGAVLDGAGWTTADDTQAAFRAYNEDIDYVTIRNLVIRNMPQWGIHAFYRMADHWTIEYNEIASNKWGLLFGPDFTIRNNYIHHNVGSNPSSANPADRGGGYVGQQANNTTIESNEIAYNGREQKVGDSANVTFRNNFVHHNVSDGIWYDFNNTGALIEGNDVEDNGRTGISFEVSNGATIQNNTLRRNAADAVLISMSQNAEIYNNSLEANVGGIQYFLNCASFSEGYDLQNNATYDNTVVIGTQSNAYANGFSYTFSSCTPGQAAPYLNGLKNLTFSRNAYRVPSLSNTKYFIWPNYSDWNQWQALGQDVGGSISQ
jgi:parallel beta-helix repeat protein